MDHDGLEAREKSMMCHSHCLTKKMDLHDQKEKLHGNLAWDFDMMAMHKHIYIKGHLQCF